MADLTEFAGLPVIEFPARGTREERLEQVRRRGGDPHAPAATAWRLRTSGSDGRRPEDDYDRYFALFMSEVDTERVTALVLGDWVDPGQRGPEEAVELLAEHADALPNLRSVFVGDITADECELSWIHQGDMAPLLAAFPRLERLATRGADSVLGGGGLGLHVPSHTGLRSLTLESGGLPGRVVREVASSGLPALEHLELWLGVEDYGRDVSPRDLEPVLSGGVFPRLRYLGVRNAEDVDAWIPVLADAPVLGGLEVLDLSLGILTDEGARALVERADAFAGLRRLDLHHHYLGPEAVERVRAAFAGSGVGVDLSDPREPEDQGDGEPEYYTAAAE
ncbi:STM4015 family protein [Nocardiopsis dassonvillei]|uniref:STM4015 family protein n=1 Tax=Nocardiopsis dassonvillei TaxID=2014 RepID=UPI0020100E40|nr:STM4015 family protein [Nocardiopsis dassonvillei]MCK9872844.1 STM4015 family protein [Nocardiopsis dassonvillei]